MLFCSRETVGDFWPKSQPHGVGKPWRMMSVNLLRSNTSGVESLLRQIREADADVLALQEYTSAWYASLHPVLAEMYPFEAGVRRDYDSFGGELYSKFPFAGKVDTALRLADHEACQIRAVVLIDGRSVAVYSVHLMPPAGRAMQRLQEAQMAGLLEHLRKENLPVLLCGDFNFTLGSYFHGQLRGIGLREAHREAGWGRGSTWPAYGWASWFPGVRIDHFYVSEEIACVGCRTGQRFGSDHIPTLADFRFKR
jgi:endonuclease/exonuclease/phosphatase (EEP) superfamily protein YafD